jgi:hypothetical protein
MSILREAKADVDAKRSVDALSKLAWLYDHALSYAPAMYGVRNSYVLDTWRELARSYPPAMARLKMVRDDAAAHVRQDAVSRETYNHFADFAAISRELHESASVKDLFVWLDGNRPDLAQEVYSLAQGPLVRARAYRLCGKYLAPQESMELYLHQYAAMRTHETGSASAGEMPDFAHKFFANRTESLVALLVQNGRNNEARKSADTALAEWDDNGFRLAMAAALKGRVPEPWPAGR